MTKYSVWGSTKRENRDLREVYYVGFFDNRNYKINSTHQTLWDALARCDELNKGEKNEKV